MWYNLFDVINMYNMIGAYNGQILVVEDDKTVYSIQWHKKASRIAAL